MAGDAPVAIRRSEYAPTPYAIDTVDLSFDLKEDVTRVTSLLSVKARTEGVVPEMVLNGRDDIVLHSVTLNGAPLTAGTDYVLTEHTLTIKQPPATPFRLQIVTDIQPEKNTALEGLYKSSGTYCSQCEAEGFRGITYFYDRPDVMSVYTVRVEADKALYPVLLSNGNLKEAGELEGGRHFTLWSDPWPKPCYLFALVAGPLSVQEDTFTTMSGRTVALRIYVEARNLAKVGYAMAALQRAMRWDEERFGLEYDLDLFNIVAVDDFNMGAMENKSLNVFNSRLILALPETATDSDFGRIEAVVGHEYFHNWTGNRVTCRDWFQLTLKEGLTVYRDSEFSSDLNSRAVKRIEEAAVIRSAQFAQDSGPMAHAIRPDEYMKIDNFYTLTVYRKGCEVIRMYDTILGTEGFRKGMDLYFKRHDGSAVTCDDFLAAMSDANGEDLSTLALWYSQAGTPVVKMKGEYNAAAQTYTVTIDQSTPPTAGQPTKVPVMLPIVIGLLGPDGAELGFQVAEGPAKMRGKSAVLLADKATNKFVLSGVSAEPTPSVLRNFSAPVRLTVEGQTDKDLAFLLQHDTDPVNRWDAGQRLARNLLLNLYEAAEGCDTAAAVDAALSGLASSTNALVEALRGVLVDTSMDGSLAALTLTLPTQSELVQTIGEADPVRVHYVRAWVSATLARRLTSELVAVYQANALPAAAVYTPDAASAAKRSYRNRALALLCEAGAAAGGDGETYPAAALAQARAAANMTDASAAIAALLHSDRPERDTMLREFHEKWAQEPLVVLKWLTMHATSNKAGNIAQMKALVDHSAFAITNPNSCYSLLLAFASSPVNFHAADGSGYEFLAGMVIKVDGINPSVAARVVSAFTSFKMLDASRQALMRAQLQRIVEHEGLSGNVFEIVSKSLSS